MNKRYGLLLVLALVLIVGIIAWHKRCPAVITIGYSADLTGRMSELGINGRNGVQTAVDLINESGGINGAQVRLLVENDKNNPKDALMADQRLVANGVRVIIGHMVSGVMPLTYDYINKNDVLMVSPTVSNQNLTGKDDHFFKVIDDNTAQGKLLAQRAFSYGYRKAAAVYELKNKAYTEGVFYRFRDEFTKLGGSVVSVTTYIAGENVDFQTIAQKIAGSGSDSVITITSGIDNAVICQQLKKIKLGLHVFSSMWASTRDYITVGGSAAEGSHVVRTFDKNCQKPAYLDFKKAYESRFRVPPDFGALHSYEAAMIVFEAMKKSGSTDPQTLKQTIIRTGKYLGLQDNYSINRFGDCDRPYHIFVVSKGEYQLDD